MTPKEQADMIEKCAHSPYYDMQTGGSKCRKCGVLLDDFGHEYARLSEIEQHKLDTSKNIRSNEPEVKKELQLLGGESNLSGTKAINTAHPPTSDLQGDLKAYAVLYENQKAELATMQKENERLNELIAGRTASIDENEKLKGDLKAITVLYENLKAETENEKR